MTTATSATFTHKGACHCGGVAMTVTFTTPPGEQQLRSCQCGFCTRHGAITVSDPVGRALIEIDAANCATYQFATRSATSLLCAKCGTYAGAFLRDEINPRLIWSIANTRGLGLADFAGRLGEPMVYEHETAAERTARRKQRWTPTEIRFTV